MYIHRKAYDTLLEWKNRDRGSTALLIEGARRVGKSFLARNFAEREYRSHIYIDFSQPHPVLKELFEQYSHDLNDFFSRLALFAKVELHERESCIIFDEVQLYPPARQLIKHLVADGRYDYIETGSLISLKRNVADIVIPSEEIKLELLPIGFEEFLVAIGRKDIWNFIRSHYETLKPLGDATHREVMKLFRLYLIVGGMPQAVSLYADAMDLLGVRRIQKNILALYRDDIAKYAEGYELKVRSIFDAIPSQLSQHDKQFTLSQLHKNARMRSYEEAFLWLADSKITHLCFSATDPSVGLRMNLDHTRLKCYMADTGLLTHLATEDGPEIEEDVVNALLYGRLSINEGMFFENVVAQLLRSGGHQLFFHRESRLEERRQSYEVDFLIRQGKKICPIEVKSGDETHHPSLDRFVEKYSDRLGKRFVICPKDLKREGETVRLPVYMTELL